MTYSVFLARLSEGTYRNSDNWVMLFLSTREVDQEVCLVTYIEQTWHILVRDKGKAA